MRTANRLPRVAVIGAGIAGLACARLLAAHRHAVTIFDKGRAPGGRISSRRENGIFFDHGAQYFTARHRRFCRIVERWRSDGLVARWGGRIVVIGDSGAMAICSSDERWVPMPSTSALARKLADGLPLVLGRRLTGAERRGDGWWLFFACGERAGPYDTLLLTLPAPQAVPLLGASPDLAARAAQAKMQPCWAVLIAPERPLALPFHGAFVLNGPLSWICRNSSKPGRGQAEALVLHASAEWSNAHLEDEPATVAVMLARSMAAITGADLGDPLVLSAHRWRYARAEVPLKEPWLYDAELCIGAAGDWCLGGRIEDAFLSGEGLAARVLGVQLASPLEPLPAEK
ncbi:MAG: FAD-dependent oxidoreductase [Rhodospirillales bacterium]|nr:FAD-dependent oxidoreductase [Rhodospirillales bacterium]